MASEDDEPELPHVANNKEPVSTAGSPNNSHAAASMSPQHLPYNSQQPVALSPIDNQSERPRSNQPSRYKLERCATSGGRKSLPDLDRVGGATSRTLAISPGRRMRSEHYSAAPSLPQPRPGTADQTQPAAQQPSKDHDHRLPNPSPLQQSRLAAASQIPSGMEAQTSPVKGSPQMPEMATADGKGSPWPTTSRRTRASSRKRTSAALQQGSSPKSALICESDPVSAEAPPSSSCPVPHALPALDTAALKQSNTEDADQVNSIPATDAAPDGTCHASDDPHVANTAVKSCRRSARKRKTPCTPSSDAMREAEASQLARSSRQGLPEQSAKAQVKAAEPVAAAASLPSSNCQDLPQPSKDPAAAQPDDPQKRGSNVRVSSHRHPAAHQADAPCVKRPRELHAPSTAISPAVQPGSSRQASRLRVSSSVDDASMDDPGAPGPVPPGAAAGQSRLGRPAIQVQVRKSQGPSTAEGRPPRRSSRQQQMGCLAVSSGDCFIACTVSAALLS